MARVYLKGLPQLKAKLVALKQDTMPAVRPAMEQAAQQITDTMKRLAPVDGGALRDSIGWTWGDAPRGSVKVSHSIAGNRITIFAGDEKAFYARFVEFGTAPHVNGGRFAGTDNPGNRQQPFFYPAYRANRNQVKLMIRRAIRDAVREAAR